MELHATRDTQPYPHPLAEIRAARNLALAPMPGLPDNAKTPTPSSQAINRAADFQVSLSKQAELASTRAAEQKGKEPEPIRAARVPASDTQSGSVTLEVEAGKRVLKVFDSKDTLIYQLPPKGALLLINSQDTERPSTFRATA